MMTFEHTSPKGNADDHRPSLLPAVLLVICGVLLFPFTLLAVFWWGMSRLSPDV
jgi:hypothetical protein